MIKADRKAVYNAMERAFDFICTHEKVENTAEYWERTSADCEKICQEHPDRMTMCFMATVYSYLAKLSEGDADAKVTQKEVDEILW